MFKSCCKGYFLGLLRLKLSRFQKQETEEKWKKNGRKMEEKWKKKAFFFSHFSEKRKMHFSTL
jgi:hypothetical protein